MSENRVYAQVYRVSLGQEEPLSSGRFEVIHNSAEPGYFETEEAAKHAAVEYAQRLTEENYPWAFVVKLHTVAELWRTP